MPDMARVMFVAAATIASCLVIVCGPAGAQPLRADAQRQWAALLQAQSARTQDTAAVDAAIGSRVGPLRAAAIRTIGQNRISARYALARARLRDDPDSVVARDAAFALGLARDTLSCAALQSALARPRTSEAAAWALGELGDACGTFGQQLARVRDDDGRAALLRVAGKWTAFPESAVVIAARTARVSQVRWAALYALARARNGGGAAEARQAVVRSDAALRDVGARLLAASLQPTAHHAAAQSLLRTLLRDRSAHVRIAAVRSVATYTEGAPDALRTTWQVERDGNVRVAIASALGSLSNVPRTLWGELWHSDSAHMVRRSLVASAWQAGAIDTLISAIGTDLWRHPDVRLRLAMIDGATSAVAVAHWRTIAALRDADDDRRVRTSARRGLRRFGNVLRDSAVGSADSALALRDSLADDSVSRARAARLQRTADSAFHHRVVREIVMPALAGRPPQMVVSTTAGAIRIRLDGVRAPVTVDHLSHLANDGYFDGLRFHRVVPAFVAQGGDPDGDGSGGPGFAIRDELHRAPYGRGAVGMALAGPDTGGSQFFFTLAPQRHLDGHYTVFGSVIEGWAAMDALRQGDGLISIRLRNP